MTPAAFCNLLQAEPHEAAKMLADFILEGQSQVMALPPFLKEVLHLNHRTQKITCHLLEQHPRRPGEK